MALRLRGVARTTRCLATMLVTSVALAGCAGTPEEEPKTVYYRCGDNSRFGVTLLKEWQRDGLLTRPDIMMSGHATIDTADEATRIGALNFLEKPSALQKLLKAVQQGLTRAQETVRAPAPAPRPLTSVQPEESSSSSSAMFSVQSSQSAIAPRMGGVTPNGEGHGFSLSFDLPLREARDAFERMYFEHHLGREGGSMTRVAEKTGLERTHLYRKLKQLGVEPGKLAKKGQ